MELEKRVELRGKLNEIASDTYEAECEAHWEGAIAKLAFAMRDLAMVVRELIDESAEGEK